MTEPALSESVLLPQRVEYKLEETQVWSIFFRRTKSSKCVDGGVIDEEIFIQEFLGSARSEMRRVSNAYSKGSWLLKY